jgi:hypothetical protein
MFGLVARSYRFVLSRIDDELVDRRVVLFLAIERSNDLLLARLNRFQGA